MYSPFGNSLNSKYIWISDFYDYSFNPQRISPHFFLWRIFGFAKNFGSANSQTRSPMQDWNNLYDLYHIYRFDIQAVLIKWPLNNNIREFCFPNYRLIWYTYKNAGEKCLLNRFSLSIECAIRFDGPKEDLLATLPLVTWNNLINFPLGNEINPPKLHFKWPSSRPERKKIGKKDIERFKEKRIIRFQVPSFSEKKIV